MDQSTTPAQQLYRVPDVMRMLSLSQGRTRLVSAAAIADYVALLQREADDGSA